MNEKPLSEFEILLKTFPGGESRERLEALRRKLDVPEQDALWVYIAALEHYQRLYEAMPAAIRAAAVAEKALAEVEIDKSLIAAEKIFAGMSKDVGKMIHDETEKFTVMSRKVGETIQREAEKVSEAIGKQAVKEIRSVVEAREKIDGWLSISMGASMYLIATAVAISVADLMNGLGAKISTIEYLNYLYNIPAGKLVIVAVICAIVLAICKLGDKGMNIFFHRRKDEY